MNLVLWDMPKIKRNLKVNLDWLQDIFCHFQQFKKPMKLLNISLQNFTKKMMRKFILLIYLKMNKIN